MDGWKVEVVNPLTEEEKKYLVDLISEFLSDYYGKEGSGLHKWIFIKKERLS